MFNSPHRWDPLNNFHKHEIHCKIPVFLGSIYIFLTLALYICSFSQFLCVIWWVENKHHPAVCSRIGVIIGSSLTYLVEILQRSPSVWSRAAWLCDQWMLPCQPFPPFPIEGIVRELICPVVWHIICIYASLTFSHTEWHKVYKYYIPWYTWFAFRVQKLDAWGIKEDRYQGYPIAMAYMPATSLAKFNFEPN